MLHYRPAGYPEISPMQILSHRRNMLTRRADFTSSFLLLSGLLCFLVPPGSSVAQTSLSILPESVLTITGRSNESDWDVNSTVMTGELILGDVTDPVSVMSLSMTVPAADIKAPRGLIMDRIMQGSLKSEEFPTILFELTSVEAPAVPADSLNLVAYGDFTLTGTTKNIAIQLLAVDSGGGNLRYIGSFPVTMTDYGMETPTAMFGRLRVHRDVIVMFDLQFSAVQK
jgi:YceI-like domain